MTRQLSVDEKCAIVLRAYELRNNRAVAREFGVSHSTVNKWVNTWRDERSILRKPGSGRPFSTSPEEEMLIFEVAASNPFLNKKTLCDLLGISCSTETVKSILN